MAHKMLATTPEQALTFLYPQHKENQTEGKQASYNSSLLAGNISNFQSIMQ